MTDGAGQAAKGDLAAPYMPFKTFTNLLVRMQQEGIPRRLDANYLQNMSGATRSQLIAGLRWFGLVDDEDRPQQGSLQALVEAGEDRPRAIGELFRSHYGWALALVPENGTQGDLDEAFRKHGVSGSTLRKATAFFLHGAKYANIPLSPFFRQPRTEGGGGSVRRRAASGRKPKAPRARLEGTKEPEALAANDPVERRKDALFNVLLAKLEAAEEADPALVDRLERMAGTLPEGK